MTIPVLFTITPTLQYHLMGSDGKPICGRVLAPELWERGGVQYIADETLCSACVELRKTIPALQNPDDPGEMCVYIIRQMGSHYYKIGVSENHERRFKQLQHANPNYLKLIWHSKYCGPRKIRDIERSIHQQYRQARSGMPYQREWFNLGPHEVQYIIEDIQDMVG